MGLAMIGGLVLGSPARAQEPVTTEPAPTGFLPRFVREGTLSLGGQAQYGTMLGRTGFGRGFGSGLGLAVRVRYRTSRESAFGVSFESQQFDAKGGNADTVAWFRGVVTTAEYYQFFNVRARAPRYLIAGAGIAQTRRRLKDKETDFPGDAGVLTLGGGTEVWLKRWLTLELSARYYLYGRSRSGSFDLTHNAQGAAGFHFYTSR